MSSLLRAVTDEVKPEYRAFIVAGVIDGQLAGSVPEGEISPPRDGIAAGADGLIIQAVYADYMHTAHVRFELWDGPPPTDAWEELWSGRLLLKSRLVGAADWAPSNDPPCVEFDLGQGDTAWCARAASKILQTEEDADFPYAIARVELYKIQFWT
ncbi:hypothetical protein [Streptosporangium sp. NPDC000396]|uniref:hypothetical protein n=1 Tax=Streptosporangium sp. NPDC000396 TaxID=3366185 RepID=UPI00369C24FD